MEIADFVARAEGAEKKLAALTARCVELEAAVATLDATRSGSAAACPASSSATAVSASAQSSLLASLATLRTTLVTEAAERDALKKENAALHVTVRKLDIRVGHLLNSLDAEEKKVEALTAKA